MGINLKKWVKVGRILQGEYYESAFSLEFWDQVPSAFLVTSQYFSIGTSTFHKIKNRPGFWQEVEVKGNFFGVCEKYLFLS